MIWLGLIGYCFFAYITLIVIRVYKARTSSYEDKPDLFLMCLFWPLTVIAAFVFGVGLGLDFLSKPVVRALTKGKRK